MSDRLIDEKNKIIERFSAQLAARDKELAAIMKERDDWEENCGENAHRANQAEAKVAAQAKEIGKLKECETKEKKTATLWTALADYRREDEGGENFDLSKVRDAKDQLYRIMDLMR